MNETIERYPEIIFQSTIGQLETMVRSFPPGIEPGEREALASLLSEFEVPSGSVLDHSFATGFSGLDLSILAALPKESRFSTDLRRGFATSVERSLEYALARGFQMVTELLQSIARYWPEGMEAAITTLSGSDSRTILHNQADKAILREFDPVNHFYRWNGEIDTRIVALFYQRFESVDWQVYTEPGRGGLATAPWLIKAMHSVEMSAAATRLADLLAQRRLSKDLHVPGHEGNKRIEMIAQVCLHCSSADAAAAYFEAMVPIVCACMREPKIYRGIVANGLWLLVRNDRIEPVRNDVNAALLERAVLNFGLKDGAFSEQSIADYMRLIGVVACGWPDAFLRQDTLEFVKRVGLEALLNHPISALPLPSVDLSFVPSHQMQYWLALFQISKIMKLPLLISRTTIDPLREKWRLNLAFDLENEPENQRVIYRHRVMLDWLDSAQGGAMALLRPGSADLRCA